MARTRAAEGRTCGARNRRGGECRLPAGFGTDHVGYGTCRFHGGSTKAHVVHAKKLRAIAVAEKLGAPRPTTPEESLQEMLEQAAGHSDVFLQLAESTDSPSERKLYLDLYTTERSVRLKVAEAMLDADLGGLRNKLIDELGTLLRVVLEHHAVLLLDQR